MSPSKPPAEQPSGDADNHPSQPRTDDVVLGGAARLPVDGVVLGGLEGVKRRLAAAAIEQRVAALKEALQYGEAGLELVMLGLEDKSWQVQHTAFSLLAAQNSPKVKQRLRNLLPFEFEVVDQGAPSDSRAMLINSETHLWLRGGSWYANPANCRSACRSLSGPGGRHHNSSIGFRVVCTAE